MKAIVTGASGFLGSRLLEFLALRGHSGVATGRSSPQKLPMGWIGARRADVLSWMPNAIDADAVVHLEVKQHLLRPTAQGIAEFAEVNTEGTKTWLAWATSANVERFILASTVKAVRPSSGPNDEAAPYERFDPYGATKAAAEEAVRMWASEKPGRCAIILRLAPIYGPGNQANLAAFTKRVIEGRLCLVGKGRARKSVVSLTNASAAVEFLLATMRPGCEVFNVADPSALSMAELASLIATACKAPEPRTVPYAAGVIAAKMGDALGAILGIDFPLTSRRLKTLTEDSIFSIDKLLASGFVHPQTTVDGVSEMARWIALNTRSI